MTGWTKGYCRVAATTLACGLGLGLLAGVDPATAAKPQKLTVTVDGFKTGSPIPGKFAFCVPAKEGHSTSGSNVNPDVKWSQGPAGTQSYAVIVVDTSVPSVFDDANQEGKTIPRSLKRIDFYHMVLVDVPASRTELAEGVDSSGITPKGKPPGKTDYGVRGVNDYGPAFAKDDKMAGNYGGYDGPCPPWNDERLHRYHFRVYALDVPSLGLSGNFGGKDVRKAMRKHVLAWGEVVGTYTQNPDVPAARSKKKAKAS
jgi:Raf kinase inhibitor-like YbhB/YbcL family protein